MNRPLRLIGLPYWRTFWIYRLIILQRSPWMPVRIRRWLLNFLGADIHPTAVVNYNLRIANPAMLRMGKNSSINAGCYIDGIAPLTIGEGVRIGSNTTILTSTHVIGDERQRCIRFESIDLPVRIEDGCWVGASVMIHPGVTISRGNIIGATTLVTKSTEPNGVYVNMPGRRGGICAGRLRDLPVGAPVAEPKIVPINLSASPGIHAVANYVLT